MLVFVLVGIGFAQSEQVTEFDVNGLKVLVKRRPNSPTVAAALFIRGGSRNIDDKNAGVEDLMLRSAIEAGKKYPRQTVRREFARTGSAIAAGAGDVDGVGRGFGRCHAAA